MWQRVVRIGFFVGLGVSLAGCFGGDDVGGDANFDGDAGTESGNGGSGPGGESCTTISVGIVNVDHVDLLFVVDDSESMREEQPVLREQLQRIVHALTTGDLNADGAPDTTPVRDLHLGVVSTNLGAAAGADDGEGCNGFGDDAKLLHESRAPAIGCDDALPSFIEYVEGELSELQAAADLACLATLGTAGCGFEQPLEAALKALWPASAPAVTFMTDPQGESSPGHGDGANAGFLRGDIANPRSALGIVVVTDEDDCSAPRTPGNASTEPSPNLRCFNDRDQLFDLERYVQGFRALRGENAGLVFFGAIVGVPVDLVDQEARAAVDFGVAEERDAYYQALLDDPRMQEEISPTDTLEGGRALVPACSQDNDFDGEVESRAYPGRRFVELAKRLGPGAIVQSICQAGSTDVLQPLIEAVDQRLEGLCLGARPERDDHGVVEACEMLWELPTEDEAGPEGLTRCDQQPWLERVEERDDGGETCRVQQLGVKDGEVPPSDGWFVEEHPALGEGGCSVSAPHRATFTRAARPPSGVKVSVRCCE